MLCLLPYTVYLQIPVNMCLKKKDQKLMEKVEKRVKCKKVAPNLQQAAQSYLGC